MSNATVTCASCDGTWTVSRNGRRAVDSLADWLHAQGALCQPCQSEAARVEAAEYAQGLDIAALEGSDAQIQWAETLRTTRLRALSAPIFGIDEPLREMALAHAAGIVSASSWIEGRHESAHDLCRRIARANTPARPDVPAAADAELTMRPAELQHNAIVEVARVGDAVVVITPIKSDELRDALSGVGFRWDASRWRRVLDETTGEPADRVIEAAHLVLAAGFAVRVPDRSLHERIRTGDYVPALARWVVLRTVRGDARFEIRLPYGDEANEAAYSLPSARYDKPSGVRTVKLACADAVADFIEMHGLSVGASAQAALDAHEAELSRAVVVAASVKRAPTRLKKADTSQVADELLDA